jgi:CheY-like chemotaxis protein
VTTRTAHRDEIDVLVVDDDEGVRTTTAEVLRRSGYQVAAVEDGLAAATLLRALPVRAMVLDLALPRLDGLHLLDDLDDPPRVVLMTARDYDDDVLARRDKVVSYLRKPVNPGTLVEEVAHALVRLADDG